MLYLFIFMLVRVFVIFINFSNGCNSKQLLMIVL